MHIKPLQVRPLVKLSKREVICNGTRVTLSPTQFNVFCLIYLHGSIEANTIMDILWGADPEGGPLLWTKHLDVHVCHINRRLRAIKLAIYTPRQRYREIGELC
jgi:DNA-binding response OmpR family regulator